MFKHKLLIMLNTAESIKENKTIKDIKKENSDIDGKLKAKKPFLNWN